MIIPCLAQKIHPYTITLTLSDPHDVTIRLHFTYVGTKSKVS